VIFSRESALRGSMICYAGASRTNSVTLCNSSLRITFGAVCVDGLKAETQGGSDFSAPVALCEELNNFPFSRRSPDCATI